MLNSLILFFVGFYILIKGAGILIGGASSVARRLNVSPWLIGIVIVGIGTSIPELAISLASAFNGVEIGLGTIAGSNTFNILVILGAASLLSPLVFKKAWVMRDLTVNIAAVVLTGLVIAFPVLGARSFEGISRLEGSVLLAAFLLWLLYLIARNPPLSETEAGPKILTIPFSILFILVGLAGVVFGGIWVVAGGEVLAGLFGFSEAFIGLTIVGIGTSLPEFAVSIIAVRRRQTAIAVGNIIGSNIFDFLGILGFTAAVRPVVISDNLEFDVFITALAAMLLFAAMFVGRQKYVLGWWHGWIFILLYIAYFAFLVVRG